MIEKLRPVTTTTWMLREAGREGLSGNMTLGGDVTEGGTWESERRCFRISGRVSAQVLRWLCARHPEGTRRAVWPE